MTKSWRVLFALTFIFQVVAIQCPFADDAEPSVALETAPESSATSTPESISDTERPGAALLAETKAMLAEPEKYKEDDWEALAQRIEAAIPDLASHQQGLQNSLGEARRAGRSDETVKALIDQRAELERAIEQAIEEVPAVVDLKKEIEETHRDFTEAMRLRVQVKALTPDAQENNARSASTPAKR